MAEQTIRLFHLQSWTELLSLNINRIVVIAHFASIKNSIKYGAVLNQITPYYFQITPCQEYGLVPRLATDAVQLPLSVGVLVKQYSAILHVVDISFYTTHVVISFLLWMAFEVVDIIDKLSVDRWNFILLAFVACENVGESANLILALTWEVVFGVDYTTRYFIAAGEETLWLIQLSRVAKHTFGTPNNLSLFVLFIILAIRDWVFIFLTLKCAVLGFSILFFISLTLNRIHYSSRLIKKIYNLDITFITL